MRPSPHKIQTVTSIGAGPIGSGWAAFFMSRGYQVRAYLHSMDEESIFRAIIDTAWTSLQQIGLAAGASRDNLIITDDLEQAVAGTQFVQESAPERLEIKQPLYARLGVLVPDDIIIASSTSGLPMTDIQADCPTPGRTIVGHPFNPPYLLPLVEIVGGAATDAAALDWAVEFYLHAGKEPLRLKKEIPGFVATRLQEALWREALHMVANGEASPEDIDRALRFGPAPRMAIQGQCMAFHVACGEGGMATNLDQFGPALKLPWTRLAAPELTKSLRDAMVEGCNEMAGDRSFAEMAAATGAMYVISSVVFMATAVGASRSFHHSVFAAVLRAPVNLFFDEEVTNCPRGLEPRAQQTAPNALLSRLRAAAPWCRASLQRRPSWPMCAPSSRPSRAKSHDEGFPLMNRTWVRGEWWAEPEECT